MLGLLETVYLEVHTVTGNVRATACFPTIDFGSVRSRRRFFFFEVNVWIALAGSEGECLTGSPRFEKGSLLGSSRDRRGIGRILSFPLTSVQTVAAVIISPESST